MMRRDDGKVLGVELVIGGGNSFVLVYGYVHAKHFIQTGKWRW
jgi:hypothetical protein